MHDGSFKSVTDQCDFIKQSFSSKKCQQYHDCCNSFCTVRMKCFACKVCLAPVLQLYKDLFIRRDEKIILSMLQCCSRKKKQQCSFNSSEYAGLCDHV